MDHDTTNYEKQLLDDWMGRTFGTPRKPKKPRAP
jgi:hypothetical protein